MTLQYDSFIKIYVSSTINPLWPKGRNIHCIAKILFMKKRRDHDKISYESRVYESVNGKSQS